MRKLLTFIILSTLVLSLSACNNNPEDDKPYIYATVYPVMFLIETIGGDTVHAERVPGSNVHSEAYDWSAKEIISMQNASMIFYIGADLDNFIPDNEETLFSDGDVELVHVGDYVDYTQTCYESHTYDEQMDDNYVCDPNQLAEDPHFWLDPNLMMDAAMMVKYKLVEYFPENEAIYTQNFNDLLESLQNLDIQFQVMANAAEKPIITTSNLFNYWNVAYDIDIYSLTADAHNDNTIPSDIIGFVDIAVNENIEYILFAGTTNSPAGEAVLSELQQVNPEAQQRFVYGIGTLTQEQIDNNENYLTLMYWNLSILLEVTK